MDLKQLRYFIAVAEELHFGRAAARLFISQPALSFDIKKLEEQLGVQLLVRTNKSVKLTAPGQVLLDEARSLLQQAEQARRLTLRSAQGALGRLRVGFVSSMLYRGLPAAVRGFEEAHPGMEVVLQEMNSAEQALALQRGQIDIGFIHRGPLAAGLRSEALLAEPFLCCLPPGHPLAGAERIDLAELRDDPFILFPRPAAPHYHDLIIACCVGAGFSPQIRHEARLWQTIVAMVAQGMGVALLPASLCRAWPGVVGVPLVQEGALSEIHALCSEENAPEAAHAFLARLQRQLARDDTDSVIAP
ncbi:LysR substrate-binding domain-containing protein [Pseudomonas sp. No.21]|jgi:DNA-binding transcriptional LysR family regulator|uniref:LysR family transcriptional regulator n=1 Tax=Pseudomonas TaxID=286 RepID=UPI000DA953B6|nr:MULTISPECIES: LysR family transcriptional regulator [Pseudomonas]MDW3712726.1 LysR family transcriptional regulator [Pseudomonas sp. 2023EL-01195]PZE13422.1 LysR family transcriptional regulator [Pseudomonas sp. 57B-090624]GJN49072.1 transcriptional regulator [Pseudomonas tohonis]